MLKYLYVKEVFREIPDEVTLCIAITGCKIHCKGCHSEELWEDWGADLTDKVVDKLINVHKGITCVCIMGGEHNIDYVIHLLKYIKSKGLKTAWYSGLDRIPEEYSHIEKHLTWLKLGHYDEKLGGLDSPTTNQRLYWIERYKSKIKRRDCTKLLQKVKQNENQSI